MQRSAEIRSCWKMMRQLSQRFVLICLFFTMLHTQYSALAAPATAAPNTTAAAPPPTATAAAPPTTASSAPPPATTSSAPPPTVSASPPLSTPPPKAAAATPPPASTPPPVKAATPPLAKPPTASAPAPKASTNLTSPPPSTTPPPKHSAPPPAKLVPPPALAPASAPAPNATAYLDPSQLAVLHALKVNVTSPDPCTTSKDILLCDSTPPPRHLISLSLKNCLPGANLSTQGLLKLSTLQALEFDNCHLKAVHVPKVLAESLKSFICTASLGRTGTDEKAEKLSGLLLSTLTKLEELSVTDVEVTVSGLSTIVQDMKDLTQLIVSRVNLPGVLPKKTWPSGLEYIDVSGNSIRGTLPSQMRSLSNLKHLDLSDNQIKGVLPNIFGDLANLQSVDLSGNQFSGPMPGSLAFLRNCSHLDLSNNQFNGTIPANLTLIRTLRYLDLSQNALTGAIPFNTTFLNRLTTLKLSNNPGLCYNHTALKSKFLTGIRNCVSVADETALAPAPGPATSNLSAGSSKSGHVSKGAAAGISIVVIVAAAAVVFGARKWWKSREDGDQFENLRAQKVDRP